MANNEDTQEHSQTLDNRSFNKTFSIAERLAYGYDGSNIVALKVNADGELVVNTDSETALTTLVAFVTDIPTAGTRVQLANNAVLGVVIQAPSTNTGIVYIGGSTVSSTVFGAELQPGQSTGLAISNTNKVYIDAATNGDDVAVLGSGA